MTQDSIYSLEFLIIYLIFNLRPGYFVVFHQIISEFGEKTLNALKKVQVILVSRAEELGKFNRKDSSC